MTILKTHWSAIQGGASCTPEEAANSQVQVINIDGVVSFVISGDMQLDAAGAGNITVAFKIANVESLPIPVEVVQQLILVIYPYPRDFELSVSTFSILDDILIANLILSAAIPATHLQFTLAFQYSTVPPAP